MHPMNARLHYQRTSHLYRLSMRVLENELMFQCDDIWPRTPLGSRPRHVQAVWSWLALQVRTDFWPTRGRKWRPS